MSELIDELPRDVYRKLRAVLNRPTFDASKLSCYEYDLRIRLCQYIYVFIFTYTFFFFFFFLC